MEWNKVSKGFYSKAKAYAARVADNRKKVERELEENSKYTLVQRRDLETGQMVEVREKVCTKISNAF